MMSSPPVPPFNDPTGGPAGADDAFLHITSQGGDRPGSRLTAFNIFGQWADNYLTNGVGAISMDLRNFGMTELTIRLELEDPFIGGHFAVTNTSVKLPAQSDWTNVVFPIGLTQLTAVPGAPGAPVGTVAGALENAAILRIIHAPGLTGPVPLAGELGVDNITALAAIPEPVTTSSVALGLAILAYLGRKRQTTRTGTSV